jgi:NAD(P)-dependent dehydrogenase (short-subunit alcohol dehydrogenase family)
MTVTTPAAAGRLAGRRILLTGAASGIGRASAELMAREGGRLALVDVNAEGLKATADAVAGIALAADLLDSESLPTVVDRAADALGGLDGVVNCAGVAMHASLAELSLQDWNRAIAINLTAAFMICRSAVRHLGPGASIVNVASGMGVRPDTANVAAYAASKGGLIAFTKAIAAELAPAIRANVVCPGLTQTPMTAFMFDADGQTSPSAVRYALGRAARPDEIARAILFLLSDEASYVTGATLAADGGRTFH